MHLLNTLYVTVAESRLRLDNDTLRVELEEETRLRVPLHHLQSVVCFGHVGLSTPLMHRLAEDGIALVLLNANGRFMARLEGAVNGNVLLRQAQHRLATDDPPRALTLAQAIVAGKLKNQRQVLLRGSRDAKTAEDQAPLDRAAQDLAASLRALPASHKLDTLRGVEGEAARTYFDALNRLVRADRREVFAMNGRSRRPPRDRMNALLSFLYAMLMNDCRSACEAAGLDAQLGFLHAVRPGRAALALDLQEEFRSILTDRLALTLINRSQITTTDFDEREGGAVMLNDKGRRTVVTAWQERKQEEIIHPLTESKIHLGLLPFIQARFMARTIRSEMEGYLPYLAK